MTIRVNNISLSIEEPLENLKGKVAKKLRINESDIFKFKILKESVDARKKDNIKFNYSIDISCNGEKRIVSKLKDKALTVILVFWFFDVIYYPILMFAVGACFAIGDFDLYFDKYKNKGYLFGIGYIASIILKTILFYMIYLKILARHSNSKLL